MELPLKVTRSVDEPSQSGKSWSELWKGTDQGLIVCWERGRAKAQEDNVLAEAAKNGELVVLPWKGGVEKAIKSSKKYGTLYYLAMWQGLRGEPLDITLGEEVSITCTRTGVTVTYTAAVSKYAEV